MDEIYKRIQDDTELVIQPDTGESQVAKFYAGKNILLTGSTGYIGKCLVEKLLRTCTEIGTIYTLVRPKKQMTVQQRMDKYFSDVVFSVLRNKNPNFMNKVVPIEGDLVKDDLGLSTEDRQLVIEKVDIIIHNAASVYFTEKISVSLKINVLSTQTLLELAAECYNIKAFMYVSTAYSHSYLNDFIGEKFYPPPGDLKMITDMIQADTENEAGLSKTVIKSMVAPWPNIYTFGKAVSEYLVQQFGKKSSFPCGVYRPSIVAGTYAEPLVSWIGNGNGPVLCYVGASLGIFHCFYMKESPILDIVPADMTTNALLVMIWDLAVYRKPKEPQMYNYGSGTLHPFTLRYAHEITLKNGITHPTIKSLWYFFMYICENYYTFLILHVLLHFIPSMLADLVLILRGKKPFVLSMCMKISENLGWLIRFANGGWLIESKAIQDIWTRMNSADHEKFYSDVRVIDYEDYLQSYWKGIRVYLLKDPMDTLPAARKRYRNLKILHYTVVWALRLLAVYFLYLLVCYVFNF